MQMSTSKGWRGELLEEAPKVELKHLTQKGTVDHHPSDFQHPLHFSESHVKQSVAQQN